MTSSSSRQGVIKRRLATGGGIVVAGLLTTVIASAGTTSGPSPVRGAPPVAAEPEPELRVTARASQSRQTLPYATTSSPITPSRDGKVVWVVNPGADTVSVIRTDTNDVIATVRVGDEPQSVAVDPSNRFAFTANAASGTVTVVRISNGSRSNFRARSLGALRTGSEPWNIVASPDGRRIFVSNSGQDTVSVIDVRQPRIIGHVDLRNSRCNDPDRERHFQPRGLAVTRGSTRLYVTGFIAFTRPGGKQADDNGHQGVVCRLSIDTTSGDIDDYRARKAITLAPRVTGFTVDRDGNGAPDPTSAFPNQMQSVVLHGNKAYLPNIAASPSGPLRFNVDTQAFVNAFSLESERDSSTGFANLHLGAREPETGKKKLFFANAWAMGFTSTSGPGIAYTVSAGSDLVVKMRVGANGSLSNTVDADTTRYIDLNDLANPATSGDKAGKNPQGIAVIPGRPRAYVTNFVSRNVSVIDLASDRVIDTIRTAPLPAPGSPEEVNTAGAEVFFSSRGRFDAPAGTAQPSTERLSSEGWQSCSSCHFKGLTDGIVWQFNARPRKSVPLNATFDPADRSQQRVLNYSAIFDEVQDFEANIRNVSGPGALAAAVACQAPAPNPPAPAAPTPTTSTLDPAHGLLIGDNGDRNVPPCVLNAFAKPNAGRAQQTITLPGSTVAIPALDALNEWVRNAIRSPKGPSSRQSLGGGDPASDVAEGRRLFAQAGCQTCHGTTLFSAARKDFVSPPAATELATETTPPPPAGVVPVGAQFLNRFLRDIGSYNLGVAGGTNPLGDNIGGVEKATSNLVNGVAQPPPEGLGFDFNADGKGNGFNVPSLLGINAVPPYYHNGACETLACVVSNVRHRTANGTRPDVLGSEDAREKLVAFLRTITAGTPSVP
jgi:YVTN family beta-propeller protein